MKSPSTLALLSLMIPGFMSALACEETATTQDASAGGRAAAAGSPGVPTGGGSVAGAPANVGGAAGSAADLLIDDFEDGDDKPLVPGGWYFYTDVPDGGRSTLTFTGATDSKVAMNGAGYQSNKSLEVSYSFDQGTLAFEPYIGFGASIGTAATPYDLSAYSGITYTYKGSAHRVRVETAEVTDYDVFGVNMTASTSWKSVILPFSGFAQEGWGKKVTFDPKHVTNVSFSSRGATGNTGSVQIDNLGAIKTLPNAGPDMKILPAAPPVDGVLESIAIQNPLQEKAMRCLTRGYNITNWLEQSRFTKFTYDEAFVEKLAQAGFKSLRLPIDLDNYVATTTGSGDTLSITVHPDLFTVLDAFDAWTKAHGLSLTVDYHQYSTLLNKANPDSVTTAVLLWGKVAEHFAANPREDLFFELLNEPELSFDGTDPTQAEWTAMAERMITAIRANDTTHTIIFGDVEWYGINPLIRRKPLTDPNVVYAFHDYDPFIFTHQGAGWTALSAVHDLPYPYDASRWSEYYADLGFNSFMESWILNSVQTYYRDGSKAALRNRILETKRWAVTNGVPVICNEFGAYDLTSRLEDRVRYYADLISIFEELAIPWQHWFMVMNSAGVVLPEYANAMHLGQ